MSFQGQNIFDLIILLGAVQGVLFALFLWTRKEKSKIALRFLALFIFGFACNSFFNISENLGLRKGFGYWEFLPLYCSLFIIASFGLFVKYALAPGDKFKRKDLWYYLPAAFQLLWQLTLLSLFALNRNLIYSNIQGIISVYNFIDLLAVVTGLAALLYAVYMIGKHDEDLKNNYSEINEISFAWMRRLIFLLFGIWLLFAVPTVYEQLTGRASFQIFYPFWLATSLLIYWIGYTAYAKRELFSLALFDTQEHEKEKPLSRKTEPYHQNLLKLMEKESAYLNPDLNLKTLADQLEISGGYLSQIINKYEEKNFFDFVNAYRVKHVQAMLAAGEHQHLNLLGMAYEAGFKSKSTFNLSFKKLTGQTPSAYKKSLAK